MDNLSLQHFPPNLTSEEACETYLFSSRWSDGFVCPRCDHDKCYIVKTRKLYECRECRTQVSVTAGTVMHKSKVPLLIWFKAIDMLIHGERELTTLELAKELGVNYRTARLMLFKIQLALHKKYDRKLPKQEPMKSAGETAFGQDSGITLKTLSKRHLFNLPFGTVNWTVIPQRMRKRSPEFLLKEWMGALTSIFLFPYFLSYWRT
jgi:transposase-like protein